MYASWNGHLPIAELLVANGADVNAKNNKGKKSISR
jgi:ankyrin repeat protein